MLLNCPIACYNADMGSDLFALSALAKELNSALCGARIDKIQQPETDEFRFYLRSQGKTQCLVISCNAAAPRMHLTLSKKASPQTAPNMCMLLRKYLSNSCVKQIGIYNNDRIMYVQFSARTELGDTADYFVFVEIMNRYSNIVFTDASLMILDAVKHIPFDIAKDHVVVRGVKYEPVKQPKTSYLTDCNAILEAFCGGDLHKYILSNISGFSGATASELIFRAGLDDVCEHLSPSALDRLKYIFKEFSDGVDLKPCIQRGEVHPMPYMSVGNDAALFDTMSDAYDALYTSCDRDVRNKARLKTLAACAKRLVQKVQKNISIDLDRLAECENMETYRVYGELVLNNIYLISRGDTTLKCVNYYGERLSMRRQGRCQSLS